MKKTPADELIDEPRVAQKSKFNIGKFFQQFNTLDMHNYGSWPLSVKVTCCLFLFLLVCLLGYFFVIQPKLTDIDAAQAQQQDLLNEFKEKDSKLRNLKQYQAQIQQMQSNFNQQLAQLPKSMIIAPRFNGDGLFNKKGLLQLFFNTDVLNF